MTGGSKNWASVMWDDLLNEDWSIEVENMFNRISTDEKLAITKFMPSVPIPRFIEDAADMITAEELASLRFYAVAYQNRRQEPDFTDVIWEHREQCKMLWNMTKKEIQTYQDAYTKYILEAKAKAGMAMSKEKAEISHQINRMLEKDKQPYKGSKKIQKDRFLHI